MNTKKQIIEYEYKNGFATNETISILAAAGWTFAKVTLFPSHYYYDHELKQINSQIARFCAAANDPHEGYMELCQRLMLAVDYITRHQKGLLCKSALVWFRPSCTEGFIKTKTMYERLLNKRVEKPHWKRGWKGLASAILDITEGHTEEKYEYWINWFKQRGENYELYIFMSAIEFQIFNTGNDE